MKEKNNNNKNKTKDLKTPIPQQLQKAIVDEKQLLRTCQQQQQQQQDGCMCRQIYMYVVVV